jgi:putative (di)nucleoside polyphosphate hydrolase
LITIDRNYKQKTREAVGAIVECEGDFLLVHKVKAMGTAGGPTRIEGEWGFPSGGIKSSEDVETALRRELAEETGLFAYKAVKELPSFEFEFAEDYRKSSGFARQHTRMFLVKCERRENIVPDNDEIDAARFYKRGAISEMLHHQSVKNYFQSLITTGQLE